MSTTLNGTRRWTDDEMRTAIRAHMADQQLNTLGLSRRMGASVDKIDTWLDGQPAFTNFRGRLIGYLDSLHVQRPAAEIAPPSDERVAAAVAKWPGPIYEDEPEDGDQPGEASEPTPAPSAVSVSEVPSYEAFVADDNAGFDHLIAELRKEFGAVDEVYERVCRNIERRRIRLIDAYAALEGYGPGVDRELVASALRIGTKIEF